MKILLVGTSVDNIKYCKEHSHNSWEIVIPIKNHGIIEANGDKIVFSKGSFYIIPPNILHTTYSDVFFSDCYIQIEDELDFNKSKITSFYIGEELITLAAIIKDAYLKRKIGFSKTLDYAVSLLLQMIYDRKNESNSNLLTKEIRNFLIDNISNPNIDMELLSEKFRYNKDYIRKIFEAEFNMTPLEYLGRLRLSRAKELLIKMQMYTVNETATLCGFNDPLYFSRFFKKKTGLSPKEYRKAKEMRS